MLIGIGRIREAEVIFRQIAADHPEYFFAHAGIMNILNGEQRLDEAEEYIKKTEFPEEIHPDAFIAYYCACARHYLLAGMDREAKQIIAFIKNIDPKHREYLYTKKLIEGTRELSKILRSIKKLAKYAKLDE